MVLQCTGQASYDGASRKEMQLHTSAKEVSQPQSAGTQGNLQIAKGEL